MPASAKWALGIALALGVLSIAGAFWAPISLLPGVLYLWAAFLLWRKDPWGGFGPAWYWSASAVGSLPLFRYVANTEGAVTAGGSVVFYGLLALLFWRAGRALRPNPSRAHVKAGWIATTVILAGIPSVALLFNRAYSTPTGSMEHTLLVGDHVLVSSRRTAGRGDVVAFAYPPDPGQTLIKRVAGVPGDRLRIVNKQLFLNGEPLPEPYVIHGTDYVDSYRDNFPSQPNTHLEQGAFDMLANHVVNGEVVVPPGNYFVLGDNRDASLDSRYWGFVTEDKITGTPWLIYWSAEDAEGGFTHTRWDRIFKRIR